MVSVGVMLRKETREGFNCQQHMAVTHVVQGQLLCFYRSTSGQGDLVAEGEGKRGTNGAVFLHCDIFRFLLVQTDS